MNHRITLAAIACLGMAFTMGCTSMPKVKNMQMPLLSKGKDKDKDTDKSKVQLKKEKEIEFGVPDSMAVIWTDSVATVPGKPTTRGLGGRFFFYDAAGETISVDGELTIYGFDDSDDSQQRKVADRKYVFRSTELQGHASENDLGKSYSFWVPWDAVGGYRTTVSVLPIFKTTDGKAVRGEMSVNVLPGQPPEEVEARLSSSLSVPYADPSSFGTRQVGFTERVNRGYPPTNQDGVNRTQMQTSTISVPRGLGQQMMTPQAPRKPRQSKESPGETPVTRLQIEQQTPAIGNTQVGTGPAPGFHRQARPRNSLNTGTRAGN